MLTDEKWKYSFNAVRDASTGDVVAWPHDDRPDVGTAIAVLPEALDVLLTLVQIFPSNGSLAAQARNVLLRAGVLK